MSKIFVQNSDFVSREVAGEFLLVPLRRRLADANNLYVLNETGAAVWKSLDGCRTLDEIRHALLQEFAVSEEEAARDIEILINDLLSIEAILEKS